MKIRYLTLLFSLLVSFIPGTLGSLATASSVRTWYPELTKPFFTPPSWLFGPVWTVLYLMIGISLYLLLLEREKSRTYTVLLAIFAVQLVLNLFWSVFFFGLQSTLWASIEIIVLWLSIIAIIILARRYSKAASWLLVPYLLWVSFAAILTFALHYLN